MMNEKVKANELKCDDQLISDQNNTYEVLKDGLRLNQDTMIYKTYSEELQKHYVIKEELPANENYKGYVQEEHNPSLIYWLKKIGLRFKREIMNNNNFSRLRFKQEIINHEVCKIEHTRFSLMETNHEGAFLYEILDENLNLQDIVEIMEVILEKLKIVHLDRLVLNLDPLNIYFPNYIIDEKIDFSEVLFIDFGNSIPLKKGRSNYINLDGFYQSNYYNAPEIQLMKDPIRIAPATDLYLVARLFLYLITKQIYLKDGVDRLYHDFSPIYLTNATCKKIECNKIQRNLIKDILKKGLDLDPDNRYQSAQEMLEEIRQLNQCVA